MRILVFGLLLLAAHFSLTAFVPSPAGKAIFYWPFAEDSTPILRGIGGLPKQSGSIVVPLLALVAGLCLLAAVLALAGLVVPQNWWPVLVVLGAVASILLFVLYLGPNSLLPIVIDIALLWGVWMQHWSVASINAV